MGEIRERAYRGQIRQGFWLPFGILGMGIYFLIEVLTLNIDDLMYVKGNIKDFKIWKSIFFTLKVDEKNTDNIYFLLDDDEKEFEITDPSQKEKINKFLKKGADVELWATIDDQNIMQLIINNKMIIEFPGIWESLVLPSILILIGLIIIPFAIKARRKHAKYFGDDKLFGKKEKES
jgi:hypothetical protein